MGIPMSCVIFAYCWPSLGETQKSTENFIHQWELIEGQIMRHVVNCFAHWDRDQRTDKQQINQVNLPRRVAKQNRNKNLSHGGCNCHKFEAWIHSHQRSNFWMFFYFQNLYKFSFSMAKISLKISK